MLVYNKSVDFHKSLSVNFSDGFFVQELSLSVCHIRLCPPIGVFYKFRGGN